MPLKTEAKNILEPVLLFVQQVPGQTVRPVAIRRDRSHGPDDMRPVGLADVQLSYERHGSHAVLPGQRSAAVVPEFMRRKSHSNRLQLLQVSIKPAR